MARALNKRKIPATPAVAAARGKTAIAVAPSDENTGMQARLIEAQAAMERDYARLREFESRYHHLFSATTESLLVVDAQTLRVLDANPAACSLLGVSSPKLVGGALTSVFHARAQTAIEVMAAEMLRGGQPGHLRAELLTGAKRVLLTASLFRQDGAFVLLLRLEAPDERAGRNAHTQASDHWAQYCAQAPDAVVLTDMAGKILQANAAFVELVQVPTERQVRGEMLGRWLGARARIARSTHERIVAVDCSCARRIRCRACHRPDNTAAAPPLDSLAPCRGRFPNAELVALQVGARDRDAAFEVALGHEGDGCHGDGRTDGQSDDGRGD